ncbi:hypothetical protein [Kiloniella antarctica]|uniref:Uncharacterized protein n=1 Tax=Kiloniella antarctica TaxID=1550907 RepID=A0ABW5BG90_9PROT
MDIIEIKLLNLPSGSDKSLLFYWLLIRKEIAPERLTYMNMSDHKETQFRNFKEGQLTFNDTVGKYTPIESGKSYKFDVINPPDLNINLIQRVENYLP